MFKSEERVKLENEAGKKSKRIKQVTNGEADTSNPCRNKTMGESKKEILFRKYS